MADRAISDLTPASQVTTSDLFVLEQNNTAKSLTGQILINDLATALDGHGGITDISYTPPASGSVEGTLTITLADETVETLTVTNGNGLSAITQYWAVSDSNSTEPSVWYTTLQTMTDEYRYLWSYITFTWDDGDTFDTTPQVIGVYGDTGHGWYVHFKYASAQPTQDSDMGDVPDKYVGVYSGLSATAPTHYTDYTWYGWKGERGYTGNSIASVTMTGQSGLVDTYTVTFTDGNTSTFTVTNGSNISTITRTGRNGLVDTYTVTLTNGQTTMFTVTNGKAITSVTWTSTTAQSGTPHTAGATDTYTISYNDGDSSTFQVYNGSNGSGSVSKVDNIDANGDNVPLLTIGTGAPTTATQGNVKSRYFDTLTSILYICVGYDSGTGEYDWRGTGVTVDAALSTSSTNPVQNKVITGKVGTTTLTTTATNLSDAVNELDAEVGDTSTMTTTATDLASAVNELDGDISTLSSGKVSKTGDTMTGDLVVSGNSTPIISVKNTDMDYSAASLASVEESLLGFQDTNNNLVGNVGVFEETNGTDNISMVIRKSVSGTPVENAVVMSVDKNGNRSVAFSDSSVWRTALNAVNKSGDTMTGDLTIEKSDTPRLISKNPNIDVTNTNQPSATAYAGVYFRDGNDSNAGYVEAAQNTAGLVRTDVVARAVVNGSATLNRLRLSVAADGTRSVDLGVAVDAWLTALGLGGLQLSRTSVSSNSSKTINIPNGSRGIIVTTRTSNSGFTLSLFQVSSSSGTIYMNTAVTESSIAFTKAANALTISNSSSYIASIYVLTFDGSIIS